LLSGFSAVAIVLAAIGLYGVLAYNVSQRTHEVGIRLALGAQKRDVLALVVGHGMKLALIGAGLGSVGALVLTRAMEKLLFETKPTDPLTFAAVVAVLTAVAFVASWLPARNAARLDPMEALRCE
jgi:ABC-type antimicrobial peptide transport system permease subunit